MDRLFEVKPVRKANHVVIEEVRLREEEFRQDAEGAGLDAAKEKVIYRETVEAV